MEEENKEIELKSIPEKQPSQLMDFLMVYGWAILVVIACVCALIYFGVIKWG